jgi:hypothetical protein
MASTTPKTRKPRNAVVAALPVIAALAASALASTVVPKPKKPIRPTIPIQPVDPGRGGVNADGPSPSAGASFVRVGDLRATVEANRATWKVRENLNASSPLPRFPMGGNTGEFKGARDGTAVDWVSVGNQLPANAGLAVRRLELAMVPDALVATAKALMPAARKKPLPKTKMVVKTAAKTKSTGRKS